VNTTAFQHLLLEQHDGILEVILNRPEKLNALGVGPGSNRDELLQALAQADADPQVGCILIRANGRSFCAGGDLSGAPITETALDEHLFGAELVRFYTAMRATQKPIVAAVHGNCLGAGLGLLAQCDFVVAADDSRFGLVEGRIGHPGATEIVPLVGATWAKFLLLTGELIDATVAEKIGLVLTVVPAGDLVARCQDLAQRIGRMPRAATILNKAGINQMSEAMGRSAGRLVGRAYDSLTKSMAEQAQAPDGRRFSDILRDGGMAELKQARDTQFVGSWLGKSRGTP
jgi:enoyl-CoA hydratase/carnithine racemase